MSWTLLRGTLHQRRTSMFWFSLSLIVYAWFMTWFYQHMDEGQFAQLLQMWPPELVAVFAGTEVSLVSLSEYFQVEYLGLMWLIIVSTALVLFAVRAFAGRSRRVPWSSSCRNPLAGAGGRHAGGDIGGLCAALGRSVLCTRPDFRPHLRYPPR